MGLRNKIDNYLNDQEYRIIIEKDYVNINNYIEILDFNSTRVSVRHDKGITSIEGTDLVVNKMVEDEMLITGNFVCVNLKGET